MSTSLKLRIGRALRLSAASGLKRAMTALSMLAAAGIWPGLPATGYLLFARTQRSGGTGIFPPVTFAALLVVIGLATWSLPLLATAVAGVYRPECVGLGGWLVTGVAFALLVRSAEFREALTRWRAIKPNPIVEEPRKQGTSKTRPRPGAAKSARQPSAPSPATPARNADAIWNWVLAVGLLLAAVLYLALPSESIYGGRDEGVYSTHAIYMAHHGRLDVPYPWPPDAANTFANVWVGFPGFYKTADTMTPQFGHLFPVWLGQAFATLGGPGLFRLNAVFAWLAVAIFYGLCRMVLPQAYAVVATLFFALNPSELWMARITLSEILTQLFVWSGLLLLLQGVTRGQPALARWAGLCLGLSAFVRFDSLLLLPLIVLGHAALVTIVPEPTAAQPGEAEAPAPLSVWVALYQTAAPTFGLAFAYFWVFSAPYLAERPYLGKLGAAVAVSILVLGVALSGAARFARSLITSKGTLIAIGVALFAAAAYAYWIRPLPEGPPKMSNRWPGYYLNVNHDYSRDTFRDLAQYLSPPVTWAAVAGWFVTLWMLLRSGGARYFVVALVVIAASSVVYMQTTFNSADHLWAVRRFIPVVIPGFILSAALGISWLLAQLPKPWSHAVAAVVATFLCVFTMWSDRLIAVSADDAGYYAQIKRLADRLPPDQLILARGFTEFLTPLYIAFDRRIVPLNLDAGSKARDAVYAWVAKQSSDHRPAYLLLEGQADLRGLHLRQLYETTITRTFIEPTVDPLPTKTVSKQRSVRLYEITD